MLLVPALLFSDAIFDPESTELSRELVSCESAKEASESKAEITLLCETFTLDAQASAEEATRDEERSLESSTSFADFRAEDAATELAEIMLLSASEI